MNCASRLSSVTRFAFLCASSAAFVAGCGGGSQPSADAGEVGHEQPQAKANVVLKNDLATTAGMFESVEAYLAQSPKVLRSAGAGVASARFAVRVPERGFYEVFAWWPQAAALAGQASVNITHARGSASLPIDQRVLGGQWNSLGVFEFDPARPGAIEFEKHGALPLLVDAVRLQFAGSQRPPLALRTEQLPLGLKGAAYSALIEGAGGVVPYSFALLEGALPPGLRLDGKTGALSGSTQAGGHYVFSIGVRDAAGNQAVRSLAIDVSASAGSESSATGLAPAVTRREQPAALAAPNLGNLLNVIAQMPEGNWSRVNLNNFSDVWTPADLRPLMGLGNPPPSKIILAWSSFAWDSNRGNLLLYGGGHANYRGNDVYLWRGATQRWERASLPSEMVQDSLGNWNAIDGADNAPASAHTYDNALFFPLLDRLVMFGGAADANGGHYLRKATETTSRKTGLYLFDPARADGNKVGGTTGSHVKRVAAHPEIVGGNMWANRDNWINAGAASTPPNEAYVNGCSGYAEEGGKDVAYLRTASALYRFTINDLANPVADNWQRVGVYWNGPGSKATCAYDASRKTLVRTATNAVPFVYWNLATPGPQNKDVAFSATEPSGEFLQLLSSNAIQIADCALDFDPQRRNYALWCGDGRVWTLTPPATLAPSGWTIRRNAAPTSAVPNGDVGTGILGKWKYIPNLDAFIALQDSVLGNVWIYKPIGWVSPGGTNLPPSVSITQPTDGSSFANGTPVTIGASASDSDGTVAKVEFYAGANKIGEAISPYVFVWTAPTSGSAVLTAVAIDDKGARTVSNPVTVTVAAGAGPTTVVLQRGAAGSGPIADTYLSSYHPSLGFGASAQMQDYAFDYSMLVRFAVFQSEGGPVPDGAHIRSAVLSLYKYSYYDMVYGLHRVLPAWTEAGATWATTDGTHPWSAPGNNGAGLDYASTPDAIGTTGFNPGWIDFDVSTALQQMSASATGNHGWRLRQISGYGSGLKHFYTSEAADPSLRPKLLLSFD